MKNYLTWVKQIAQGLDLPVVGWQISIGNMDNPNTADVTNMANAYKDTFFPYFFKHVSEFTDAGFIGFLVGKGLQQATDFTLPGETVGEKGWFLSQLKEFDKKRPYLDTTKVSTVQTPARLTSSGKVFSTVTSNEIALCFSEQFAQGTVAKVILTNLRGQQVSRLETAFTGELKIPTSMLARGTYLARIEIGNAFFVRKFTL